MLKLIRLKIFFVIKLFFFLLIAGPAHAYLDPVTINTVIQFIILVFASIISFFSIFYKKSKDLLKSFLKIFKKKKKT